MPTFRIIVVNQTFTAADDHELPSVQAARNYGIKAALGIGADEVSGGKPFFGAEVKIEQGDNLLGRFVVSIGASQLQ